MCPAYPDPLPLTPCPVPLPQRQSHSQSGNDYSISRQENLSARHRVPSKRCDKGEADCRLPLPCSLHSLRVWPKANPNPLACPLPRPSQPFARQRLLKTKGFTLWCLSAWRHSADARCLMLSVRALLYLWHCGCLLAC